MILGIIQTLYRQNQVKRSDMVLLHEIFVNAVDKYLFFMLRLFAVKSDVGIFTINHISLSRTPQNPVVAPLTCQFGNETGGFWLNLGNKAGGKTGNNTQNCCNQ
jgi:hypothetical protein